MKRGYSIKGKPKKNHEEKISMIQYFFKKINNNQKNEDQIWYKSPMK